MRSPYGFETQKDCLACKCRENGTFCNVSGSALRDLQRISRMQVHRAGTTLFAEGQAATGVFILCSGRAKVSTASERGNIIILRVALAGDVLGMEAVLANRLHGETVELLDSSRVKFIRKKEFIRYISKNMQMALKSVMELVSNYDAVRDQVRILGSSISGSQKLAQLLIRWAKQAKGSRESANAFAVPFTHEEIAQMIGSSRETVTRALNHLKRNTVIEIRDGIFNVKNMEGLLKLAIE